MKHKIKLARVKHRRPKLPHEYSQLLLQAVIKNGKNLISTIDEYISKGANPNAIETNIESSFYLFSPLMLSAHNNNISAMLRLIQYGANFAQQNYLGQTAIELLWDNILHFTLHLNRKQLAKRALYICTYCSILEIYMAESQYCGVEARISYTLGDQEMRVNPGYFVASEMKKLYPQELKNAVIGTIEVPYDDVKNDELNDDISFSEESRSDESDNETPDHNQEHDVDNDLVITNSAVYYTRLHNRIASTISSSQNWQLVKWYQALNSLSFKGDTSYLKPIMTLTLVCKFFALYINKSDYENMISPREQITLFQTLPYEILNLVINLATDNLHHHFPTIHRDLGIGMHLTIPRNMGAVSNFRNFFSTAKHKEACQLATVCKYFTHTINYRNNPKPYIQNDCPILSLPTHLLENIIDMAFGPNTIMFQRNITYINAAEL